MDCTMSMPFVTAPNTRACQTLLALSKDANAHMMNKARVQNVY